MAKSQTVYYYEYYPHYSGDTLTRTLSGPLSVFKNIQAQLKRGNDEEAEELADTLGDSYFLTQALSDEWDEVKLAHLSRRKNKSFGGTVEEGSVGFSLTSAKAAKKACMAAEAQCMVDCGDEW